MTLQALHPKYMVFRELKKDYNSSKIFIHNSLFNYIYLGSSSVIDTSFGDIGIDLFTEWSCVPL